jgi:hypothetical protein
MADEALSLQEISPEVQMLRLNNEAGYNYQFRRYEDWNENYDFYRGHPPVNRLIQRQTVHIPLMKLSIRTLLKDVDDMPVLYFENLDNDKQAEMFKNDYWEWTVKQNNMTVQDIVDKKQVFLYGRSFDQWQIIDGKVTMTIQDPVDIRVDRYCNPYDIDSARFLIHTNIFIPLSSLKLNPDYDQDQIEELEMWYATQQGLIKAAENETAMQAKEKKLADLGVLDAYAPVLGETYVELSLHFVFRENESFTDTKGNTSKIEPQYYLYVLAEGYRILMKKPLEEVIGVTKDHFWRTHLPYVTWADDVERQDFWSDGVGDIIRTSNKIINVYFSQQVENRTLRSMGMQFYDQSVSADFRPQSMQPQAFGWYGLPGKPSEMLHRVDIPDLSDVTNDIEFLIGLNEKATGATATQEGAQTQRAVTLGEVQLLLSEAKSRIKGMSKFYTPAWERRGLLFTKLLEAAPEKLDIVTIHKKGLNTNNIYSREISPDDWRSKKGYNVKVWSQEEKDNRDSDGLQKLNAAKTVMPNNPKLQEIYERKLLEFANLTPQEINEIMQYEEQQQQAMLAMQGQGEGQGMMGMAGQPMQQGQQPPLPMPKPQLPTPQPQLPAKVAQAQ